jgi:hypothetical protein
MGSLGATAIGGSGRFKVNFQRPRFADGVLELRVSRGEVCIYGTPDGLAKLQRAIGDLLEAGGEEHLHLEDREMLTADSLRGVIAVFEPENQK